MKPTKASGCLQEPRLPGSIPRGTWETGVREAFQRWFWQLEEGGEKREHQGSLNLARLTENKTRYRMSGCVLWLPMYDRVGSVHGPFFKQFGGAEDT